MRKGEPRAERGALLGEPIVMVWYERIDDPMTRVVRDGLRFEEIEGQIARLRYFAFCSETLAEIVGTLGLPLATNGYGIWAPEFLSLQKQEEFQQWVAQRASGVQQ